MCLELIFNFELSHYALFARSLSYSWLMNLDWGQQGQKCIRCPFVTSWESIWWTFEVILLDWPLMEYLTTVPFVDDGCHCLRKWLGTIFRMMSIILFLICSCMLWRCRFLIYFIYFISSGRFYSSHYLILHIWHK